MAVRGWRHDLASSWAVVAAIGLSVTAATFPGERMEEWVASREIPPFVAAVLGQGTATIFESNVIPDCCSTVPTMQITHTPQEFFPIRSCFRVSMRSMSRKSTISKLGPSSIHSARKDGHFEGAIFEGADLRKINLENAQLQGASLARGAASRGNIGQREASGRNAKLGEASGRIIR